MLNTTLADFNAAIAVMPRGIDVSYTMSASKSFNYDGDVLTGVSTDLTFMCAAPTPNIDMLKLPWAATLPVVTEGGFSFVSYDIEPNYDSKLTTFTRWRETYRRTTESVLESTGGYFDITETVECPVWILKFHYWDNPYIGSTQPPDPTTRRLRQVYGLTPVQGEIQAKTFTPITDVDPYTFLNVDYATFNGAVRGATVGETIENGKRVYTLALSWTGGSVGSVPTYKI